MEIVKISSGKKYRPPVAAKAVVVKVKPQSQKKKKNSSGRKNKGVRAVQLGFAGNSNNSLGATPGFQRYIMAPDIYGPFRQPRAGGASKTGLAYDQTLLTITGDQVTNTVQGILLGTPFNQCAYTYTAANVTSAFSSATTKTAQVQTPSQAFMDDVNMVAASMVVEYLGSPLNAIGELTIGNVAADIDPMGANATYSGLYFYPGFIHVPIASLIDRPLRVWARKCGPAADQFINPQSIALPDIDLPFVATSGQLTGSVLNVTVTRAFEFRSSTTSGDIYPYETQSSSFSKDFDAFTDARVAASKADPSAVSAAMPDYVNEFASTVMGDSPLSQIVLGAGASALVGHMGRRYLPRSRNNILPV